MAKSLVKTIKKEQEGRIKGIKSIKVVSTVTHHQFMDDTILVGKVQEREEKSFKRVLIDYEIASHQ